MTVHEMLYLLWNMGTNLDRIDRNSLGFDLIVLSQASMQLRNLSSNNCKSSYMYACIYLKVWSLDEKTKNPDTSYRVKPECQ